MHFPRRKHSKGLRMKANNSSQTKFSKIPTTGYRISEVDRFLKKVEKCIRKADTASLLNELASVQFTITKRLGYSPKEIDDHLDSLMKNHGSHEGNVENQQGQLPQRSTFSRSGSRDIANQEPRPVIESQKLRNLTPPIVSGVGYAREEVDHFLSIVADSLERFEKAQGKELDELRADQYLPKEEEKPLLAGDQVRYALFSVSENGGYDMLGVDAAVNRLAEALDFHWSRTS